MTDQPRHRLRAAIDVGPLYGHRTGVGTATAGMVDALGKRDDVELDPYLVSFRSTPLPGHRRLAVPGIVASHLWSRTDRPRVDRWSRGADLIHGTNYVVPPTRLPSVVSVYDCWFLRHPERATPVVRRAGDRLRRAVRHGAWVHASSDATAGEVRELLLGDGMPDRVVTIHLGPPPAPDSRRGAVRPAVAERLGSDPFVLAIGTEERRKDLVRLTAAFDALARRHAGVRLVLAGARGDASESLDAAIDLLPGGAHGRIDRLGPVDDDTKFWLLRHASVLAYPSLDEGFGFPIIEAQQAGTPVVGTAVGAVGEVGGDGVELVTPGDTDALADALERALVDESLRSALIEGGRRNLERFSWSSTAEAIAGLYRRAVEASA